MNKNDKNALVITDHFTKYAVAFPPRNQRAWPTAKSLSERLEGVTAEKEILIAEYDKTNKAIQKYNKNIDSLKA